MLRAHGTHARLGLSRLRESAYLGLNNNKKKFGERLGSLRHERRDVMAYSHTAHPRDFRLADKPARKAGLFARFVAALALSRRRQAEREIERFLRHSGMKFTDEAEREIERRFFSTPSRY
jgi:hypothetical protein